MAGAPGEFSARENGSGKSDPSRPDSLTSGDSAVGLRLPAATPVAAHPVKSPLRDVGIARQRTNRVALGLSLRVSHRNVGDTVRHIYARPHHFKVHDDGGQPA